MVYPYLPHTGTERKKMLDFLGISSIEELLKPLPAAIRLKDPLDLPAARSEMELRRMFRGLAAKNANLEDYPCFLGAGIYQHYIPAIVDHLADRSEFYTAYTPYQPEISQGMLQVIFEFQTMIAELCGLPVANASLYDGASAAAEAALMALDATGRRRILLPRSLHPDYRQTLATYRRHRTAELVELPLGEGRLRAEDLPLDRDVAALFVGYPNFFGQIEELPILAQAVHSVDAVLIVIANPIALGLLESPGRFGADIVTGEGQPLGNPPSFGGPGLGFLACREEYVRRIPGRLVGQTADGAGRRGFVLTLQAREQHIRRQKATSNICSNAALLALRATVYLAAAGPEGLRQVAQRCADAAHYAFDRLTAHGRMRPVFPGPFFHEFALTCPARADEINARLWQRKIIGGLDLTPYYPELGQSLLWAVTEVRTIEEIDRLAEELEAIL